MIASARMYAWSPSLTVAWQRLLDWVAAAAGVDLGIRAPLEAAAHVDDAVVLVDHHAVGDERVAAAGEADDPAAADQRAHAGPT